MKTAIVIGGGIAGCSTAFALSQRGVSVTLLERHAKLAQEASGNPLAMLYPKLGVITSAPNRLAMAGFLTTLNLLKHLADSASYFKQCGQIQLAFNAREHARQQRLVQHPDWRDYFQLLSADSASEQAGIKLNVGGLFLPQAGWVKPAIFCEALTQSGLITKIYLTDALTLEKIQHQWCVKAANNHSFIADIVVICNANEIKQFQQCSSIMITPVRGQINFFTENAVSQSIKTILCSDHYVSPSVDGVHSIGTTYAPNDLRPQLSETDTHENLHAARTISNVLWDSLQGALSNGRVAWRSATLDYMPLAGQLLDDEILRAKPPRYNANPSGLPWLEELYVNAGHGSKGMITAPLCGELIASLATNEAPSVDARLMSKLNPSRFLLREFGLKQLANALY
ncbi:MAG: FAD-dependent 5-carboxymethylaminomethyl-2-thiouridine(34) oxidoreductase MnmC [Methylophilaceae bacterium]